MINRGRMDRRIKKGDQAYGVLLTVPGIATTVLLVALPFVLLIMLSFSRYNIIAPMRFVGFGQFSALMHDSLFLHSLRITVSYTAAVVLVSLLVSTFIAYGLHHMKKNGGATVARTLVILPFGVPLVLSGMLWRWLLNPGTGLANYILMKIIPGLHEPLQIFASGTLAFWACVFSDSWIKIPFMSIVALAGMDAIGRELYEAAEIDGASLLQRFVSITWPLSRRYILYGILITSMFSFRTIDAIWAMTGGGPARATYVLGILLINRLLGLLNIGTAAAVGLFMFAFISVMAAGLTRLIQRSP